ncbi:MAG: hypothetical protein AAF483_14920 [Planctomycetota bacterium]
MSFALLPILGVLIGILVLGLALWLLQRLRVQHQEVEVISTLFWQAALKETRARVFVKRFRHWPAWLLLLAIASLLWMLLAQPRLQSQDGLQHVVLLDWSIDDPERRASDLNTALEHAASLPVTAREIVAVGSQMRTLLASGEELQIASVRAEEFKDQGSPNLFWALENVAARSSENTPVAIHCVGNPNIEQTQLDALPEHVSVYQLALTETEESTTPMLESLGFGDAASGNFKAVDVRFQFTPEAELTNLTASLSDQPLTSSLQDLGNNQFLLQDLPAAGGTLSVSLAETEVGALSLPSREAIRVQLEEGVPNVLREMIELDEAFKLSDSTADVTIGFSEDCDLQLSSLERSAFEISTNDEDPQAAMLELVDTLALRQIDATSLAQQSGQTLDVQVVSADSRSIAVWESLFTTAFDFVESRACPIFVARAIHWLADKPSEVQWAEQGNTLPAAAPGFTRADGVTTLAADGRELRTTRLSRPIKESANLDQSPAASLLWTISPYTWLGVLASVLLVGEWFLYQRGRMP